MQSLSLILPVYADDSNIIEVIRDIDKKFEELGLNNYEFLVFLNSESTHATALALSKLSRVNQRIRIFSGPDYDKIGSAFAAGIKNSRKSYVGIWSAYNQADVDSFDFILPAIETSDVVLSFIKNPRARQWYRMIISKINVFFLNLIFDINFRYYHLCFFKTKFAQKVKIKSGLHSAMSEVAIWLAKSGARCTEVPFIMIPHHFPSKSRALSPRNIVDNISNHLRLFIAVRLSGKKLDLQSDK